MTEDEQAAHWALRLDAEPLDNSSRKEFDSWLAADVRRRGSLLRAQALLCYLDRGRALAGTPGVRTASGAMPSADAADDTVDRRGLIAAGAFIIAVAGLGFVPEILPPATAIDTATGEIRRLPLADGSVAMLNTRSRLTVTMEKKKRIVRLEEGEAWFQIAHDRNRPFIVEAGQVRVQAIGTAFSVRREGGGTEILVNEGVVESWIVGKEGAKRRIAAGSKGVAIPTLTDIAVAEAGDDVDRALAWRSGELILKGETLQYAVEEMNRYNAVKIILVDTRLGETELVGLFKTNEPENFARSISAITGATLVIADGSIRLEHATSR